MFVDSPLKFGDVTLASRLITGTGKYKDLDETADCLRLSGCDMVTVAIRRVPKTLPGERSLWDAIPSTMTILPNTAGCYTVDDCVRTAHLARELIGDARGGRLVKVEVIGDEKTLFPDVGATIAATEKLTRDGFICLPYVTDDPVACLRLLDVGAAAVMPLAAPIGSGLGVRNPHNLAIILELVRAKWPEIPVIVDAGVGVPSDAAQVMEMGADGVLMNTAIAGAQNPRWMAEAMRDGVRAGRMAYKAGRIPMKLYASASSPLDGLLARR
ncbi:MAG: thiazole synthase [Deltaproteobacteria bacterium]|nr:thiazole synthase [Deltaproteobacteria bacterium]